MPQSLARNIIHLVFSTKNREPLILLDRREALHGFLSGVLSNCDSASIVIGSVSDHIHILFVLSKNHALCKVVEKVKSASSAWAKENGFPPHFYWQNGYGAFSLSPSHVEQVRAYILNQDIHHGNVPYQDEFREFLHRHEIEYDERYVWD